MHIEHPIFGESSHFSILPLFSIMCIKVQNKIRNHKGFKTEGIKYAGWGTQVMEELGSQTEGGSQITPKATALPAVGDKGLWNSGHTAGLTGLCGAVEST